MGTSEQICQYRFSLDWASLVDKTSEAWRAYCEAVWLSKIFLKTSAENGREAAKKEVENYLEEVAKKRGESMAEMLRADSRDVVAHEHDRLLAEIQALPDGSAYK